MHPLSSSTSSHHHKSKTPKKAKKERKKQSSIETNQFLKKNSTNKMGICISIDSASVSPAKLILQDGQLLEFSYPVSVAYVLQKNPDCFICNSDEMEFDDIVTSIDEDEDLQPGQLYFALPISRLSQPLLPEEMAALAVKASAALMRNGDGLKGLSTTTTNQQRKPRRDQVANSISAGGFENKTGGNRRTTTTKKSAGGKGRKFASQLGAIPE